MAFETLSASDLDKLPAYEEVPDVPRYSRGYTLFQHSVIEITIIDYNGCLGSEFGDCTTGKFRIMTSSLPAGLTAMINAWLALLQVKPFKLDDYILRYAHHVEGEPEDKRRRVNYFKTNSAKEEDKHYVRICHTHDTRMIPQLTLTYENIYKEMQDAFVALMESDENTEEENADTQDETQLAIFEECMRHYMNKLFSGELSSKKTREEKMGDRHKRTPGEIDYQDDRWDKIHAAPGDWGLSDNDCAFPTLSLRLVRGTAK